MKTTTKLISAIVVLIFGVAPGICWAGSQTIALTMLIGAASLGDDGPSAVKQADELLHDARQAMAEGNFDTADVKISRAEALHPKYSMFHAGDTPKKARADLEKQLAQKAQKSAAGKGSAGKPQDPFITRPSQEAAGTASKSLTQTQSTPPAASKAAATKVQSQPALSQPTLTSASGAAISPSAMSPAAASREEGPNPWEIDPPAVPSLPRDASHASESQAATVGNRYADTSAPPSDLTASNIPLDNTNGLHSAPSNASSSHPGPVNAGPVVSRPLNAAPSSAALLNPATNNTTAANLAMPEGAAQGGSLKQSDKARAVEMTYQARSALAEGETVKAEQLARQAAQLVPDSAFAPREDRPTLVLLDIQRTKRKLASGVITAGGPAQGDDSRYPGSHALYNPANDGTRNMAATSQMPQNSESAGPRAVQTTLPPPMEPPLMPLGAGSPTPENGTGEGMRWYRKGLTALGQSKTDEATQAFRRAWAFHTEMDPETCRQLADHLKILGVKIEDVAQTTDNLSTADLLNTLPPGGNVTASASSPALLPGAAPGQTGPASTRQVAADVSHKQGQARDMTEKKPKQALELLQNMRATVVANPDLDPVSREQLLRRLDISIAEVQKHIAQNAPQIELDEKNKKVTDQVDRERKQKVEVQEKIAYLVDDFNKLVEEQRYAEARVLAKRALELDPKNPVVQQLNTMGKFLQRMAQQQDVKDAKEEGFYAAMYDVDKSAVPFVGPYEMPDVKTWERLTKARGKGGRGEGNIRRSPKELEIEQRLTTPVSLKFQARPLAEVITYLGKIAQVPVFLDPKGMAAEGVGSDTPITIDLSQDISLKSALKLILEPLRLTYMIKDEVLKITSEDMRHGELYSVTYPVADLVIPIPNFVPDGREGINAAMREAYGRMGWSGAAGGSLGPMSAVASNEGGGINPTTLAQIQPVMGVPIGSGQTRTGTSQGNPGFGTGGAGGLKGGAQADFDSLINLIQSTIGPPTIWRDVNPDGGTIEPFETNLSLVIYQTQEKHEEIADLLQQLRRLQDLQVTIEVRFITLNDAFFEQIGVNFDFNIPSHTTAPNPPPQPGAGLPSGAPSFGGVRPSAVVGLSTANQVTPLQDIQFRQGSFSGATPPAFPGVGFDPSQAATFGFAILSDIEAYFLISAAQGDNRSNVLQAPKVTLFNGQLATVTDVTQRPFVTEIIPVVGDFAAAQQPVIVVLNEGTTLTVQAVVSSDRRFVRLTVVPFFSNIGEVDTFTFSGTTTTISNSSDSQTGTDTSASSAGNTQITEGTTVQLPQFSIVSVATTVSVPDGGTVLLGGIKRLSEGRNEQGVPILSKLPYINRLFRNVGIARTTNSLMMMVTPRIIIQEEEEENLLGTAPAP